MKNINKDAGTIIKNILKIQILWIQSWKLKQKHFFKFNPIVKFSLKSETFFIYLQNQKNITKLKCFKLTVNINIF